MKFTSSHVVVAAIAFALGAVGTAGAAKMITGKQIRNGTITAKDLSKGLRAQIAKTGAQGPAGAQGAPGDPGPKGDKGDPATTEQVMAAALAADGAGSTLDADLLDGVDSTGFLQTTGGTLTGALTATTLFTGDGTPAAPGFAFASDKNTGFHRVSENVIGVSLAAETVALFENRNLQLLNGYFQAFRATAPADSSCASPLVAGRMVVYGNSISPAQLYVCDNDISGTAGEQPGWVAIG